MLKTENHIHCADRYIFDFNLCTISKGYAQFDTASDASYHGIWSNPTERTTITFIEGDVIKVVCDNDSEYTEYLNGLAQWYMDNDEYKGIDCGFDEDLKVKFASLDLQGLLY